jgi:DNA damage-binding protein 2
MGPTTRARFVHNRRGGGAQYEASDDDEEQATSSSSSEEDADDEGEEAEASSGEEVGGGDEEDDEEEADSAEPAAKEFPQAPATGGRKGPITISLKKVCKVVVGARNFSIAHPPNHLAMCSYAKKEWFVPMLGA